MNTLLKNLDSFFASSPDHIALRYSSDPQTFSYGELDTYSARVYAYLKARNIGREDVVLVHLPRGLKILAILVGIWKAGAAVVVCEDSMSPERVRYIASDCGCKLMVEGEACAEIERTPPLSGRETVSPHNAAYIVYTSGSTGNPKGVIHEFGNLEESIRGKRFDGKPYIFSDDILAVNSPLNFVAAMDYLICVFNAGACLLLMDMADVKNPERLSTVYEEVGVSCTFMTPSLYKSIRRFNSQLRWIQLGGEPCIKLYNPDIPLYNGYNLSESGRDLCIYIVDRPYELTPIGHNRGGEDILLLDEDGQPVAVGEIGEICFRNEYVRGYIGLPEKTELAWRGGIFHTGDLASRDASGELTLHGRNDDMIKINGNRIEPAEIENAAKTLLQLQTATAKGFVTPQSSFVVLYYTDAVELNPESAREALKQRLPGYMIPSYFVHLDALPLLNNGKLDRKGLPMPRVSDYRKAYAAPSTPLEEKLCALFEKHLELERIGIDDDFYELGGDSVKSMAVLADAELPQLDITTIYTRRSVRKIAEQLEKTESNDIDYLDELAKLNDVPLVAFETYIFDYQVYAPLSTLCNMPHMWKMKRTDVDTERLIAALYTLIENHPSFKTVFRFNENETLVKHYDSALKPSIAVEDVAEEELEKLKATLVAPYRLLNSPFYRFRVFRTEEHVYLFMDVSHLISDGTSLQIMEKNLSRAYHGEALEKDYYYMITQSIFHNENSSQAEASARYNNERYGTKDWVRNITPDHRCRSNHAALCTAPLGVSRQDVDSFLREKKLSLNILSIAAALLTLKKHEHRQDIMVSWLFSGRDSVKHGYALGLLIRELPVAVSFDEITGVDDLFASVKEQTVTGMEMAWDPYIIRNTSIAENDMFCVRTQGALLQSSCIEGIPFEPVSLPNSKMASCMLDIQIAENEQGELETVLAYNNDMVETDTAAAVSRLFSESVAELLSGKPF